MKDTPRAPRDEVKALYGAVKGLWGRATGDIHGNPGAFFRYVRVWKYVGVVVVVVTVDRRVEVDIG